MNEDLLSEKLALSAQHSPRLAALAASPQENRELCRRLAPERQSGVCSADPKQPRARIPQAARFMLSVDLCAYPSVIGESAN